MRPSFAAGIGLTLLLVGAMLPGCVAPEDDGQQHPPLEIRELALARLPPDSPPRIPFEPRVGQGEILFVAARDVGPFLAADERRHGQLSVTVHGPEGDRVYRNMTNLSFERRVMPSFQVPWAVQNAPPGTYEVTVRVTDRVVDESVRSTSRTATVTVADEVDASRDSFGANGWAFLRDTEYGREQFNPSGAFVVNESPTIGLMDVGPFAEDEEGKHHMEVRAVVENASGATVQRLSKGFTPREAPDGVFRLRVVTLAGPSELAPGNYTVEMTVLDTVADASFDPRRQFRVLG